MNLWHVWRIPSKTAHKNMLKHANHLAILVHVNVEKRGTRRQAGHGRHRADL
jgi:hypothetical protein